MAQTNFPLTLGVDEYIDPYAQQLAAQRAKLQQPLQQMYSPEQQAQRVADNNRQYQLGLLGQLSGDEALSGVGGQVLRQAMAARQPHVTERGVADPITGQFTYNPAFLREKDEAALAAMENRSAAARGNWDSARQAAAERRDLYAQRADDQRMLRAMMGANRAAAGDQKQSNKLMDVADRMADDFNRDTKTQQLQTSIYKNLQATAAKGDAASDMAFIFQYMKMLDPGSVVREGEFATAQNAAGIPARILNMYNRARSGNFLNAQQRADMLAAAGRLNQEAETHIGNTSRSYGQKAQRRGIDPLDVVGDYVDFVPPSGGSAAPAAAPAAGGQAPAPRGSAQRNITVKW